MASEFIWKTQGDVQTCLSGSGNVLGTVRRRGDKFVASAFGKEAELNFERSAKTFVQAAAGRPAQVRAADANDAMSRMHSTLDRMCDAKGIDPRDHLHRALDAVLARRSAKSKDLLKPPSIVMDSEGRLALEPVGK